MPDRKHNSCATHNVQSGISMLEVLVALLVLSLAFLGVTALQTLALAETNHASARSMAIIMAHSMLDGVRLDEAHGAGYGVIDSAHCGTDGGSLAQYQRYHFCQQLDTHLGAGSKATITCNNDQCRVSISLPERLTGITLPDDGMPAELVIQGSVR